MLRLLTRLLGIGSASCVFPGVPEGLGEGGGGLTFKPGGEGWGGAPRDLLKRGTTLRRSRIERRLDGSQGRT